MKLLKVGKTKALFQKKDGTKKYFKITPAVKKYIKNNIKVGAEVKPQFTNGKITKLTVIKSSKKGGSMANNYSQENMLERSAVSSACTALTAIEGVTVKNYKQILKDLIDICLTSIKKGKISKTSSVEDEELEEDDLDEGLEEGDEEVEEEELDEDDIELEE